jgi:hypothetical protein
VKQEDPCTGRNAEGVPIKLVSLFCDIIIEELSPRIIPMQRF